MRLAILHDHILKRVGDIFAVVGRLFQKLVDLFQLHDVDGIFLVREQSRGPPCGRCSSVTSSMRLISMQWSMILVFEFSDSNAACRLLEEATML